MLTNTQHTGRRMKRWTPDPIPRPDADTGPCLSAGETPRVRILSVRNVSSQAWSSACRRRRPRVGRDSGHHIPGTLPAECLPLCPPCPTALVPVIHFGLCSFPAGLCWATLSGKSWRSGMDFLLRIPRFRLRDTVEPKPPASRNKGLMPTY